MAEDPYEHVSCCRVAIRNGAGASKPPVRLSKDCLRAAQSFNPPPLYDFSIEKTVLEKQKQFAQTYNDTSIVGRSGSEQRELASKNCLGLSWKMPWQ
ncbi:hypothetical protein ACA910_020662 [Epithemia clementina (nom. ined.)]